MLLSDEGEDSEQRQKPSRILNNFLIYRELDKREGQTATPGPAPLPPTLDVRPPQAELAGPSGAARTEPTAAQVQRERALLGSLTSSYRFKENGLVKKTISVAGMHMICYYQVDDVVDGRLRNPSSLIELLSLEISPALLINQNFRVPPKTEIGEDGQPRYVGESDDGSSHTAHGMVTFAGNNPPQAPPPPPRLHSYPSQPLPMPRMDNAQYYSMPEEVWRDRPHSAGPLYRGMPAEPAFPPQQQPRPARTSPHSDSEALEFQVKRERAPSHGLLDLPTEQSHLPPLHARRWTPYTRPTPVATTSGIQYNHPQYQNQQYAQTMHTEPLFEGEMLDRLPPRTGRSSGSSASEVYPIMPAISTAMAMPSPTGYADDLYRRQMSQHYQMSMQQRPFYAQPPHQESWQINHPASHPAAMPIAFSQSNERLAPVSPTNQTYPLHFSPPAFEQQVQLPPEYHAERTHEQGMVQDRQMSTMPTNFPTYETTSQPTGLVAMQPTAITSVGSGYVYYPQPVSPTYAEKRIDFQQ